MFLRFNLLYGYKKSGACTLSLVPLIEAFDCLAIQNEQCEAPLYMDIQYTLPRTLTGQDIMPAVKIQ